MSFTTPWALAALAVLPVIWWLLRFTPPRPQTLRFPPLRILLQLVSREDQADHTPWWLMALRLLIAALFILPWRTHSTRPNGAALPALAHCCSLSMTVGGGEGWQARQTLISETLSLAERESRPVALATTSPTSRGGDIVPVAPQVAREAAAALEPKAFDPIAQVCSGALSRLLARPTPFRSCGCRMDWTTLRPQAFATGLQVLPEATPESRLLSRRIRRFRRRCRRRHRRQQDQGQGTASTACRRRGRNGRSSGL